MTPGRRRRRQGWEPRRVPETQAKVQAQTPPEARRGRAARARRIATEPRRGARRPTPDYVGDQALLPRGGPGEGAGLRCRPVHRTSSGQLSIEESKYLGGDMEHTHLVKRIRFALLRKVRAEMKEKEKATRTPRGRNRKIRSRGRRNRPRRSPRTTGEDSTRTEGSVRFPQRHAAEPVRRHRVEQGTRPEGRPSGLCVGQTGV